jgi:hypothetical protein
VNWPNDINEVLAKPVGGKLWTEVVGFTKRQRPGGGHVDEWNIALNVDDMEILGPSDKPVTNTKIWPRVPIDELFRSLAGAPATSPSSMDPKRIVYAWWTGTAG